MACFRHRLHVEYIDVEVYSQRPIVMRIRRFVGSSTLDGITSAVNATNSDDPWMQQDDPAAFPLLKRMQQVIRLNPEVAEDFMVFKYGILDNTRPHYDYLSPTGPHYDDRRLEGLGNRLATTLLMVKTATKGGDLLLWFNADSNEVREDDSVHAGCPIEKGEKIALTLWFRSKYQDGLKCSTMHAGYEPLDLLKRGERHENDYFMFDEIM
ncbi:CBN-PHY-4 protein [Aphelenchoides avenae]|nr:CBN-PHY-4 protein [Aphelenchus avenae]